MSTQVNLWGANLKNPGRKPYIMLKRQRVLLRLMSILQKKGKYSKVLVDKMLFLLREEHSVNEIFSFYSFFPYKFGPFSNLYYYDLRTLQNKGFITEEVVNEIGKEEGEKLVAPVIEAINSVADEFDTDEEIKDYVYSNYPEYTVRSELIGKERGEYEPGFFTIGYEKKDIDGFLNILIQNNIEVLADVRYNPFSMNFAFIEGKLREYLEKVDIEYIHFKNLGIPGEKRENLVDLEDYKKLFEKYSKEILPRNISDFKKLVGLGKKKRVAMMCFERDAEYCHRGVLSREIEKKGIEVEHL